MSSVAPPMTRDEICAFLHFGYVPPRHWGREYREMFREFTAGVVRAPIGLPLEGLVEEGVCRWREVFSDASEKLNVVPLSGGMDSRAILGGLLRRVGPSRLLTVTFGQPGSLDYELGLRVAEAAGVESLGIDLSQVDLERERLVKLATAVPPGWLFDTFYNRMMFDRVHREGTWWSGYFGDTLAGSRLKTNQSATWVSAGDRHVSTFRRIRSMNVLPSGFDPRSVIPQEPLGEAHLLTYDEQLNFFARQPCAHTPVLLDPRADMRTPFLDARWRDFILGVPWALRVGEVLYKAIIRRAYPELVRLPVAGMYGLPGEAARWRIHMARHAFRLGRLLRRSLPVLVSRYDSMANYIDFDHAIRHREDVQALVHDALRSLGRRGVIDWLYLFAIWKQHMRRLRNHGDALTVLAALDLNLEAAERGRS